jgi:hypothetical protein
MFIFIGCQEAKRQKFGLLLPDFKAYISRNNMSQAPTYFY